MWLFFRQPLCSRVRFIVYLGEMLKIKVRVHLRGAYVCVPKHLLNRPQIPG